MKKIDTNENDQNCPAKLKSQHSLTQNKKRDTSHH